MIRKTSPFSLPIHLSKIATHYPITIKHITHQDTVVAHKFWHSTFEKSNKCRSDWKCQYGCIVTVNSFEQMYSSHNLQKQLIIQGTAVYPLKCPDVSQLLFTFYPRGRWSAESSSVGHWNHDRHEQELQINDKTLHFNKIILSSNHLTILYFTVQYLPHTLRWVWSNPLKLHLRPLPWMINLVHDVLMSVRLLS